MPGNEPEVAHGIDQFVHARALGHDLGCARTVDEGDGGGAHVAGIDQQAHARKGASQVADEIPAVVLESFEAVFDDEHVAEGALQHACQLLGLGSGTQPVDVAFAAKAAFQPELDGGMAVEHAHVDSCWITLRQRLGMRYVDGIAVKGFAHTLLLTHRLTAADLEAALSMHGG